MYSKWLKVRLLCYEMDGAASLWGDSLVPSFSRVGLGDRTSLVRKLCSE